MANRRLLAGLQLCWQAQYRWLAVSKQSTALCHLDGCSISTTVGCRDYTASQVLIQENSTASPSSSQQGQELKVQLAGGCNGWNWSSHQQLRGHASTGAAVAAQAQAPKAAIDHPARESQLLLDKTSNQLANGDVASYYNLRENLVPEATRAFHQSFYPPRPPGKERRGGCQGLQAELGMAGRASIMHRRCIHELRHMLAAQSGARLLLAGPPGSGKSLALVALVEWARGQGWLAMYLPSATSLTAGGYFVRRSSSGLHDTPISAQHILKGVHDVHSKELEKLPRLLGGRQGTLADLALAGLSTDNPAQSVDACLALRDELVALSSSRPVLLAVDDYNALYWTTDYGTHPPKRARQLLRVEDLSLASGMRLLDMDLGAARVVCATTGSRAISPRTQFPLRDALQFHVPRYSEVETAHALAYYHVAGVAPSEPSEGLLRRMQALTNGNAAELRRLAPRSTALEMNII